MWSQLVRVKYKSGANIFFFYNIQVLYNWRNIGNVISVVYNYVYVSNHTKKKEERLQPTSRKS